jgi:hypothetical protein
VLVVSGAQQRRPGHQVGQVAEVGQRAAGGLVTPSLGVTCRPLLQPLLLPPGVLGRGLLG